MIEHRLSVNYTYWEDGIEHREKAVFHRVTDESPVYEALRTLMDVHVAYEKNKGILKRQKDLIEDIQNLK